jgi:pimeloyl-ACP methyl ester carboxylesterase
MPVFGSAKSSTSCRRAAFTTRSSSHGCRRSATSRSRSRPGAGSRRSCCRGSPCRFSHRHLRARLAFGPRRGAGGGLRTHGPREGDHRAARDAPPCAADVADRVRQPVRPRLRRARRRRCATDRGGVRADRLHEITTPTLLISGRHDEATPRIVSRSTRASRARGGRSSSSRATCRTSNSRRHFSRASKRSSRL